MLNINYLNYSPSLSFSISENGGDEENFIFATIFSLFYNLLLKPCFIILDIITTQIFPLLTGKKLFNLIYSLFQSQGLFTLFLGFFALFLPFAIILIVFSFFLKNSSYKFKNILFGAGKGTLFIMIVPTLFFGIYSVFFLFGKLFFKNIHTFSLANIIYRLGYSHDTNKTYEDVPNGGFTGYNWLVVMVTLFSSFYLIINLFLPLIIKILELFILFLVSPFIALSFTSNEQRFLTWKNDVLSRFVYSFIVQLLWFIFLLVFIKLTSNPFKLDLQTSHLFIGIIVFAIAKTINMLINLILTQLGLQASSPTSNHKSQFYKLTNFIKRRIKK